MRLTANHLLVCRAFPIEQVLFPEGPTMQLTLGEGCYAPHLIAFKDTETVGLLIQPGAFNCPVMIAPKGS
jgi:hypothetical protein